MHLAGVFVATSDVAPVREWLHARPARASGSRPNCHLKKCQLNRVKIPPLRAPLSRKPLGAGRHRTVLLLSVLLLTASFLVADDSAIKLLGRWRSLETSRGGIGSLLAFRKEGIVEYNVGAVVEMPYRVEGDQLVLPSGTEKGPEQRQTMTFSENRLRLASIGEPGTELIRQGRRTDASEAIVGEWRGVQEMNGRKMEVFYFFYPKGRGLFLMPFLKQQGNYSTVNGRIHLTWPNCPMPDATFKVEGDVLTFTPTNSRQARYARY